jgi:vanillate O-demethylase ferredoxin subunit
VHELIMNSQDLLDVRVTQMTWCSPSVLAFDLTRTDGGLLPGFAAGAHVSLHLVVKGDPDRVRAYSLINLDPENDTTEPQPVYRIAVRRDELGAGGSRHLHAVVRPGELLRISRPKNAFQLGDEPRATLLAGGIGVTPIASMAAQLRRKGATFDVCYAVRSCEEAVFLPELTALCPDNLQVHVDDIAGHYLDVSAVLRSYPPRPVYVCGPKPMIDTVIAAAAALGWAPDLVRFELFGADPASAALSGYEVVLELTGKTLAVRPGQTLLDVLIDQDVDLPYDCRAGFCGLCQVKVIDGDVAHHDTCLTDDDRNRRRLMQPCVSHATSSRLVLDL